MNKKNKFSSVEFLFILCYFSTTILKPVLVSVGEKSKIILLVATLLLTIIYIIVSNFEFVLDNIIKLIYIVILVSCLFGFDFIFRNNSHLGEYYYIFIINGVIPLFNMVNVSNYKKIIKYWSICSVILGIVYLADPLKGYRWTTNYMNFGFGVMLPAFIGACIIFYYYKIKKILPLIVIFFCEIVIFANKGSIVSAIVGFIIIACGGIKNKNVRNKRIALISIIGLGLIQLKDRLLLTFVDFAEALGVNSYSLQTLTSMFNDPGNNLLLGRSGVWNNVMDLILKKPFQGYGLGTIEQKLNQYAHNLVLDLISTFGIIVGGVFILIIISFIFRVFKIQNDDKRYFTMIMCALALCPLMFSMVLWQYRTFWIFIGAVLFSEYTVKENTYE